MDEDDGKVDLISDLPPNVIEMILVNVGIKDAVRTSLLSRIWRYRWTTIPNLVFNNSSVDARSERHFIHFITYCLFLHNGPINKFFLWSSFLGSNPVIDQWLLFLSRKDIKELSIELAENEWFRAPSCLFTCLKLTHLELVRCELFPPPSFKGFLFLKSLSLQQFVMPLGGIQNLISSCPLLETLNLWSSDELELTLSAPNLKYLTLEGEYKEIYLENTPLLVDVIVSTYMSEDTAEIFENRSCNYDRFFRRVPCLERLVGQIYFTKYLSKGLERSSMSIQFDHLKSIELDQVCFGDMDEVCVLLRLLVNSPNLKELYIWGSQLPSNDLAPDRNFWETQCPEECMFSQLKTVKFGDIFGLINEMEFIKFILERSPILKTLTIVTKHDKLKALDMLIVLTKYRRVSAQAELIFEIIEA